MKDLRECSSPDLKIFLIGNKSDLEESRVVTYEQGLKFKEDNNIYFFTETSAKTGKNTQEVFIEAARVLYHDYLKYKKTKIIINSEKENQENSDKSEKINLFAFSTNEIENTPNDIIKIFLEQQNHELLIKTKFSIAFSTTLNNSSKKMNIYRFNIKFIRGI